MKTKSAETAHLVFIQFRLNRQPSTRNKSQKYIITHSRRLRSQPTTNYCNSEALLDTGFPQSLKRSSQAAIDAKNFHQLLVEGVEEDLIHIRTLEDSDEKL